MRKEGRHVFICKSFDHFNEAIEEEKTELTACNQSAHYNREDSKIISRYTNIFLKRGPGF